MRRRRRPGVRRPSSPCSPPPISYSSATRRLSSAPSTGFADAIRGLSWRVPWEKLTVGGGEIAGGITAYATATLSWLRLRPADAVYATALTVMVTFLPFWLSIPRYLLSMYPLFLLAGRIRRGWIYLPLLGLSFVALIIFGLAFSRGYWAF